MQRLKIKLFDRFDRDKLHGGTQHRLGDRFGVAEVVLLSPRIGTDIAGRHQPRIVTKCLELATEVMRTYTSLHADEARRHVGEASVDLAARQLLAQNDGAHLVEADEVERILADVDADCRNGFKAGGLAWHGMLLVFAAPCQLCGWAGQEHGGSIPLTAIDGSANIFSSRITPRTAGFSENPALRASDSIFSLMAKV